MLILNNYVQEMKYSRRTKLYYRIISKAVEDTVFSEVRINFKYFKCPVPLINRAVRFEIMLLLLNHHE